MKNNLISWLQATGLDEQRANIYLTLLGQGEATAKQIAELVNVGRTAVYDNLRVLQNHGYVNMVRQGRRQIYLPLHPDELYRKFESQKQQLKDLLPDFLSLYAEKDSRPFVQAFQGHFAAREVYEDILRVAEKEYIYVSPSELTLQVVDRRLDKAPGRQRHSQ